MVFLLFSFVCKNDWKKNFTLCIWFKSNSRAKYLDKVKRKEEINVYNLYDQINLNFFLKNVFPVVLLFFK